MNDQDPEQFKLNMRKYDAESIQALYKAAGEYHAKHSSGAGGAAICICGAGGGGSAACRGLSVLRELFTYADFDNPEWVEQFQFVQRQFL